MSKPLKQQARLTDTEWDAVEAKFAGSQYLVVIQRLRSAGNNPRRARDLLDGSNYERGVNGVNEWSRKYQVPFVLVRMRAWTPSEKQSDKLLALARREEKVE